MIQVPCKDSCGLPDCFSFALALRKPIYWEVRAFDSRSAYLLWL